MKVRSQFSFVMRYKSEEEIAEVVRGFEDATISRDAWKHAEHLTVALHYLSLYDIDTATEKMRTGIFKLLGSFSVDLTKEMPYHETLTVFWMRTVADFGATRSGVPMVENKPLARALLKTAKVGTLIPYELYMAVAEVLAFVLRTRGSRSTRAGSTVA